METQEAAAFLAGAVPKGAATWADLGAGDGTFTLALAWRLGPGGRIYAVDRNLRALTSLARQTVPAGVRVIPVAADFTGPFDLPGLEGTGLDGLLLGNALHFVRDSDALLTRLVRRLRPGGRVVLIEYDGRPASRWVPYPVPLAVLPALAAAAGLTAPAVTATRPSAFGGVLYVATAERLPATAGR